MEIQGEADVILLNVYTCTCILKHVYTNAKEWEYPLPWQSVESSEATQFTDCFVFTAALCFDEKDGWQKALP